MARFPTVVTLAEAPVADVLRAWAGLGYNRRALALHRAARVIVEQHRGEVPSSVEALEALPGVGPYTARAVAAIAFGLPVGAVDTNVRRVLGRVAAGGAEAFSGAAMQALADAVVPAGRAGAWTHALMDVGARVCRAARPVCTDCPADAWCRYAAGERVPSGGAGFGGEAWRRGRRRPCEAAPAGAQVRDDEPLAPRPDPGARPGRGGWDVGDLHRADGDARDACDPRGGGGAGLRGTSRGPRSGRRPGGEVAELRFHGSSHRAMGCAARRGGQGDPRRGRRAAT